MTTSTTDPDPKALWKLFDPSDQPVHESYRFAIGKGEDPDTSGDDQERMNLITDINIALALNRPLLLTGPAGVGKSRVAKGIADVKGWSLLEFTVNSATEADDLKARPDYLRRLNDANDSGSEKRGIKDDSHYIDPGAIWLAFDPAGALDFANPKGVKKKTFDDIAAAARVKLSPPPEGASKAGVMEGGRVLLIDEIDKGDLDFANNLLDAFDNGSFAVPGVGTIEAKRNEYKSQDQGGQSEEKELLVVITSNGEQDLSAAFLRRCIPHQMELAREKEAMSIAELHNSTADGWLESSQIEDLVDICKDDSGLVNSARLIDLLYATLQLRKDKPDKHEWEQIRLAMRAFQERRTAASLRK